MDGCSPGYCRHKHGQTGLRNFPSAQFRSEDHQGRAPGTAVVTSRHFSRGNEASNKHYVQRQQLLDETGRAHADDRCVAESKSGRRSGWGGGGRDVAQQRGPVVVVRGPASRINQAPKTRSSPPVPILHDHQQPTTATAPRPPQHFRPHATVAQKPPFPPPPPSETKKRK